MSLVVDTVFTGSELDRALVAPHEDIDADVLKAIVANLHYLWSRKGARVGGMIFGSHPYTLTQVGYGQGPTSTGDYDLTNWYGVCTPQRREAGATPTYGFTLIIQGRNIDVRATVVRFNSGGTTTQIGQWIVTNAGTTHDWATGDIELSEAACHMSGSTANPLATLGFYLESKYNLVGNGASELLQFHIIESIGVAVDLPDS